MSFVNNKLKVSTNVSRIQFRFDARVSKWYIMVNGNAMWYFNSFKGAYVKSYFESLISAVANAKARGVLPEYFKVEDLPLPKIIVN